ncbi:MAG TPA: glycosyltransferase family 25 protein [Aquabacterium sp.]|nr:glycosyltransferase family 25 protein [Aquabacterium sp.]
MPPPLILLINLDRSRDRLERCGALLDKLGLPWERVPAVEGAKLDPATLKQLNPQPAPHGEWFRGLTPGEIGCFLSHLKCWELIAQRQLACALILEDDFDLEAVCTRDTLQKLADSSSKWDVLKLTRLRRQSSLAHDLGGGIELRRGGKGPEDACAYMVSHQGATKLIQQRQTLLRPVDFDFKFYWERDLTVLSGSPNFFRQVSHEEAASVIGDRTDYRRYPTLKKWGTYLRKHRYHIRFWLADKLHIGRRRLI